MQTDLLLPLPPATVVPPRRGMNKWRSIVVGAFGGAMLGGTLAILAAKYGDELLTPLLEAMPSLAVFNGLLAALMLVLAIVVHELGHVVGGMLQGFRFVLFIVGPFRIDRDPEIGTLRVGRNRSLEMAGGAAACMPVDEHDLVRRVKWLVAGGPLASALFTALGASLALVPEPHWWSGAALLFASICAALTLATTVPMQNGSFVTDGKRFLQLHRGGAEARRDAAQFLALVKDQQGVPVRELSAQLLRDQLIPADASMHEVLARAAAYAWLVAHGEVATARLHLARAAALADGLPFNLDAAMALEEAVAFAWYDRDAAQARERLRAHQKVWPLLPESDRLRFDASMAIAEERMHDALTLIERARVVIASRDDARSGSMQWMQDRFADMERAAIGSTPRLVVQD